MATRPLLLAGALSVLGCASPPRPAPPAPPPSLPPVSSAPPSALPAAAAPPAPPAEEPASCGALPCRLYDTPIAAFRAVLAQKPLVLAVGEAHAQKDATGLPSTAKRFTDALLPELSGKASDLVIELMAPPPDCEKRTETAVRKEMGKVTARQAATNQNEYVAMGDAAKRLGIQPHLLHPTCADLRAIRAKGADPVDVSLRIIARLMGESAERLLARNEKAGVEKIVVLYGGALHNDLAPLEGDAPYAFGPALAAATRGRYVDLDVFFPEQVKPSGLWLRFPWYPRFDPKAHPEKATLFSPAPTSFALLLPASHGG